MLWINKRSYLISKRLKNENFDFRSEVTRYLLTQNRRVLLHESPSQSPRRESTDAERNFLPKVNPARMINFPEKLATMFDTRNEVCSWKCFYINLKETRMSRALQLNTWGPAQGPRACTRSSFPETRVRSGIELRSRDLHARQSSGYFIEPSEYITGSVYISIPVRDISKVATIIRWTRTFTRLHRPETPVFNARVREQGVGRGGGFYCTWLAHADTACTGGHDLWRESSSIEELYRNPRFGSAFQRQRARKNVGWSCSWNFASDRVFRTERLNCANFQRDDDDNII